MKIQSQIRLIKTFLASITIATIASFFCMISGIPALEYPGLYTFIVFSLLVIASGSWFIKVNQLEEQLVKIRSNKQ